MSGSSYVVISGVPEDIDGDEVAEIVAEYAGVNPTNIYPGAVPGEWVVGFPTAGNAFNFVRSGVGKIFDATGNEYDIQVRFASLADLAEKTYYYYY